MNAHRLTVVTAIAGGVLAAGCHHRGHTSEAACLPVAADSGAALQVDEMPGTYTVTFVATAGSREGRQAVGRMILRPQDAGLVRVEHADTSVVVRQPTIGQLDLALEEVGAARIGDPMSQSDSMPGVGFYVTQLRGGAVTAVVARVGSGANVRGLLMFDGSYFSLFVRQAGGGRIAGEWRSGTGEMNVTEARGYFCAAKT